MSDPSRSAVVLELRNIAADIRSGWNPWTSLQRLKYLRERGFIATETRFDAEQLEALAERMESKP